MAQFTVCDTCGTILVDNLSNSRTYHTIKTERICQPYSYMAAYPDRSSYVVCNDCFKKIKEGIDNLTDMNFKGKVPVVHVQLSRMTSEKGKDDENPNS